MRGIARAGLLGWLAGIASACGGGGSGGTPTGAGSPTPAPSASASPRAVRIMAIGDSITQGNTETDSYRRPLWRMFQDARVQADFVGTRRDNNGGPPPNPDFDMDHEGYWGWRADEVLAVVGAAAAAHRPDVALVHLGSNDVFQGQDNASTLQELSGVVERLRAANPSVTVLLAQLIPTSRPGRDQQIVELNAAIPGLAARLTTPASAVVVVDQYSGFDPARETRDGTHPNPAGEAKMAQRWFAAYRSR
jgi:lysophospholipase L1-like esterase